MSSDNLSKFSELPNDLSTYEYTNTTAGDIAGEMDTTNGEPQTGTQTETQINNNIDSTATDGDVSVKVEAPVASKPVIRLKANGITTTIDGSGASAASLPLSEIPSRADTPLSILNDGDLSGSLDDENSKSEKHKEEEKEFVIPIDKDGNYVKGWFEENRKIRNFSGYNIYFMKWNKIKTEKDIKIEKSGKKESNSGSKKDDEKPKKSNESNKKAKTAKSVKQAAAKDAITAAKLEPASSPAPAV
ncbi:hypothetical protein B5S31_g1865 [[Candida] boidinii]|uniref:Unnamed protein product n=1 Tax=Candida boidinii TaxID=5477 RepID=A0ACB5UDR9_CANBO|nr:hypothetical protein B5S29_g2863 [[Candida] boidinii]OWB72159.1 hypothetical protein B5S31_g1865 [[Candida] boidinii]GMF08956.1 unnamed protein product [[Candida] boidinii]